MGLPTFLIMCLAWTTTALAQPRSCAFRADSDRALGEAVLAALGRNHGESGPLTACSKRVHLTFDDGPVAATTTPILNALRARNIKATFFVSTTKLPAGNALVARAMDEGHAVGSHGHEHTSYDVQRSETRVSPTLSDVQQRRQIAQSVQLLNGATGGRFGQQRPRLFRFPYGRGFGPSRPELDYMERTGQVNTSRCARDNWSCRMEVYRNTSLALQRIAAQGFGHMFWSHDSKDSETATAPVRTPSGGYERESLARYTRQALQGMCEAPGATVVSLFHDIHPFNAQVMPVMLDVARCLGVTFVDSAAATSDASLQNRLIYMSRERIQQGPTREGVQVLEEVVPRAGIPPTCASCERAPAPTTCPSPHLNANILACTGGSSVCVEGRLIPRGNPQVAEVCGDEVRETVRVTPRASCRSDYRAAPFAHCEGETSVCLHGMWVRAADPLVQLVCPDR